MIDGNVEYDTNNSSRIGVDKNDGDFDDDYEKRYNAGPILDA